jgi:hypothetical protein
VNPAQLALLRAQQRLIDRLELLGQKLEAGDDGAWPAYCESAAALAAIAPLTVPGASGELLDTKTMAARLGISSKTLLRRKGKGEIAPAVTLGARGKAAFRWAAR